MLAVLVTPNLEIALREGPCSCVIAMKIGIVEASLLDGVVWCGVGNYDEAEKSHRPQSRIAIRHRSDTAPAAIPLNINKVRTRTRIALTNQ
jgi:hypothetical protein